MSTPDVKSIIERVEQLLSAEALSERTELTIQELLNVVDALSADKKSLVEGVERLRKQLKKTHRIWPTSFLPSNELDLASDTVAWV